MTLDIKSLNKLLSDINSIGNELNKSYENAGEVAWEYKDKYDEFNDGIYEPAEENGFNNCSEEEIENIENRESSLWKVQSCYDDVEDELEEALDNLEDMKNHIIKAIELAKTAEDAIDGMY